MDQARTILHSLIPGFIFRRIQPLYHFALAWIAALAYRHPSRSLTVIGVTGTNGKTTVIHLLHEMLHTAGHRVGSLSSLRFRVGDRERPNLLKMTMPGRFELQRFLAECRHAGCRFVILEVTSEGIKQFRHRFISFHSAVLTNITPEHLESHGGFAAYCAAKIELFRSLPLAGFAVLNQEDESALLIEPSTRAKVVWYSRTSIDVHRIGHPVRVASVNRERMKLEVQGIFLEASLGGAFNVSNVLAAVATSLAFGVSMSAIAQSLRIFQGVAGRLEYIIRDPFSVVVDYAHTPDALEKVYATLGTGLVCVFGAAGGGRDRWKRPAMGEIASRYCRIIILTSEDPDDEDPAAIAGEIRTGIPAERLAAVREILDRRAAIRAAICAARPDDTVIITGMGAQPWFIDRGGKKIPWNEAAIAREEPFSDQ